LTHLSPEEFELAVANALRYFPEHLHATLAPEFAQELREEGHIYMRRFRPTEYAMRAYPIECYPGKNTGMRCIMLMIMNNLDPEVAQFPEELITYGGNGSVFSNWAQYHLIMKYLSQGTENQTLTMYSGHPMGLFPSTPALPRMVISNGMVIPNYSSRVDYDRLYALGVSMYGQMTAGSYCYIGPQGIVHGTTITILNAGRKYLPAITGSPDENKLKGRVYLSSGLGGMSGAQGKAGLICGAVTVIAEIDPAALNKRYAQGWITEKIEDLNVLVSRVKEARANKETVAIGFLGNIVSVWERFAEEDELLVDLASDQTSLHNPFNGGYYPVQLTFEESKRVMVEDPERFKALVQESLRRQVKAINSLVARGCRFWDYGNCFLLEAARAGADILADSTTSPAEAASESSESETKTNKKIDETKLVFKYPSYVQEFMGDIFSLGFGPFRWVCTSGDYQDLYVTDRIATLVLRELLNRGVKETSSKSEQDLLEMAFAQAKSVGISREQAEALEGPIAAAVRQGIESATSFTTLRRLTGDPEQDSESQEVKSQLRDNLTWIERALENRLVVGSKARILYADSQGRSTIAASINAAIQMGIVKGPVVLSRDHHDVSGTDSPFRETSNVTDGSKFCADMAVQNVIGDAMRGATWVALHNGGGVGWGEVINGGFGLVLDGTPQALEKSQRMLFWDVNNGVARRAWSGNANARQVILNAKRTHPDLEVTVPSIVDRDMLKRLI